MKFYPYLLLVVLLFAAACKTTKPDAKNLDKNGALIVSMERTPCYGRCPVYEVKIYENGLLLYNAKKFTDTTGCFYRVLTKQQLNVLKNKFIEAGFFSMANTYPEDQKAPSDLPRCILFFNSGAQQKTITDKGWQSPETLTGLAKAVDSLLRREILHNCDN